MISDVVAPSLAELVERRALDSNWALAFLPDGEGIERRLTFRELAERSRGIALRLEELGVAGEPVLILVPASLDFVAALLGCIEAGGVAAPTYPPTAARLERAMPRLKATVELTRARVALTTRAVRALIDASVDFAPAFRAMTWVAVDEVLSVERAGARSRVVKKTAPALLQLTSGTVGPPRAAVLTHENVLENLRQLRRKIPLHGDSTVVSWLPPYHDIGLGLLLGAIDAGARSVFFPPLSFFQRPARWFEAIARFRGTISAASGYAYDLCARRAKPAAGALLDLSSWEVALVGSEPPRAETLRSFVAAFSRQGFRASALRTYYSLAEGGFLVAGGEPLAAGRHVASGTPHEDEVVKVVDPALGRPCATGTPGEIWVSGPNVAREYWLAPGPTSTHLEARLRDDPSRVYLRTGDLGFLTDEGALVVVGRSADVLPVGGKDLSPQHVEWAIDRAHPAVRPACSAAFAVEIDGVPELVVALEVERRQAGSEARFGARRRVPVEPGFEPEDPPRFDPPAIFDAVRSAIEREHEVAPHTIVLLKAGSIPKTPSGRVQRGVCRADFLAGTLDVVELRARRPHASTTRIRRALDVALLVDTTGRMGLHWNEVRRRAGRLVTDFQADVPASRLAIVLFKDHGSEGENQHYLTLVQDFTGSAEEIGSFLLSRRVAPGHGGGGAEAVECALHRARTDLNWRAASERAIVLVGDKPPHGGGLDAVGRCPRGIDYRDEVEALRRDRIRIYTVLVGDSLEARRVFEWMSGATGGRFLELPSPRDLAAALVGVCLSAAGRDIGRFAARLAEAGALTDSRRALLDALADPASGSS